MDQFLSTLHRGSLCKQEHHRL